MYRILSEKNAVLYGERARSRSGSQSWRLPLAVVALLLLPCFCALCMAQGSGFTVRGRVVDALSRQPVPFALVTVYGNAGKGASADSLGRFAINGVEPGLQRLAVSCMGYKDAVSDEYVVSATLPPWW